ncbi:MAG: type II secretion system F family protein [Thermoplasmatota archaeon]
MGSKRCLFLYGDAMNWQRTLSSLDISPLSYIGSSAALILMTILTMGAIVRILPAAFTGTFAFIPILVPFVILVLLLAYPRIRAEQQRREIDRNLHFFVTHMGVLATSQIPRSEILRLLGEKSQYGAIAGECAKIHQLTEGWHMSLPDACRMVARKTPSEVFGDFLDRLAYTLDSGEELDHFIKEEQTTLMEEHISSYRRSLYGLENLTGLFESIIMSILFVVIFAVLMPVILGVDATFTMEAAFALVAFVEFGFVMYAKAQAPMDLIWHEPKQPTRIEKLLWITTPIAAPVCVPIALLLLRFTALPIALVIAIALLPLLLIGIPVAREEELVKRREDNFAAFIRSLGASTAARGGDIRNALRHLQRHDFGPLTDNIRNLYRRLSIMVDDDLAWAHFAAECGSNLIEKSSRMFMEGLRAGGKPDAIGTIISENFVRVLIVRKERYQTTRRFRAVLYGLIAGMAFALFIAIAILGMLTRLFTRLGPITAAPFIGPAFHFTANMPLLSYLVIVVLLVHAMASSLMVKVADGGSYFRAYVDLVGMYWVAAVVAILSDTAVSHLLP